MGKYSTPVTYQSSYKKQGKAPGQVQGTKREYAPLDWSRVDVPAMIERHTSTRLSGKGHHTQLVGACPFDDCSSDTDGFIVFPNGSNRSTEKSIVHYLCRNCPEDRRSGDVIKLLRLLYPAWGFQRAKFEIGMIDEEGNETHVSPAIQPGNAEQRKRALWLTEQLEILRAYYNQMQAALALYELPQRYLKSRGISLQEARAYGLGYFPTREEARRNADDEHIGKWAGRLIFPLSDAHSELTFEGRTLLLWQEGMSPGQHKEAIEAYNASHDERIERVLKTSPCGNFGYTEAVKQSHMVIAEGPCDALSLLLANIEGVVAMGTSLTAKAIPLSVEYVTLALDSDAPGKDAAKRLASGLADRGIEVKTVLPLNGKDWNDTHVQDGLSAIILAFSVPATVKEEEQDTSSQPSQPSQPSTQEQEPTIAPGDTPSTQNATAQEPGSVKNSRGLATLCSQCKKAAVWYGAGCTAFCDAHWTGKNYKLIMALSSSLASQATAEASELERAIMSRLQTYNLFIGSICQCGCRLKWPIAGGMYIQCARCEPGGLWSTPTIELLRSLSYDMLLKRAG